MSEPMLRKGWTRVAFGDVVRQVQDRVDPDESGLDRFVAGEHMDSDDLRIRRWGTIGAGYLGPAFHMRFRPGQILYGSRRTYLRKVAVPDFEGITANTTFVIESKNSEVLLPAFLPFIMRADSFHEHSKKQSKGSVNPYVNFSDLAWYQFPLPPLGEQRRIARLMLSFQQAIESFRSASNAGQLLLISSAAKVLRQDALMTLCSNEPVCIPAGWRISTFTEVSERITYGFTNPMPTTEDGPWMVTAADVRDGQIDYSTARHTSQQAFDEDLTEKSRTKVGDVLLTKDGTLGRVAIVDRVNLCINQSVAVLRPNAQILPDFLAWVLRAPLMQRRLMLDVGGSAVKHIYITKVGSTRFLLPPIERQHEIKRFLEIAEEAVRAARSRGIIYAQLGQALLERAIRGSK